LPDHAVEGERDLNTSSGAQSVGERPGFVENHEAELTKSRGVAPTVPESELTDRLERLRELIAAERLDGILVFGAPQEPTWLRYLANYVYPFVIAEGFLLVTRDREPILMIDRDWYLPQAHEMSPFEDIRVLPYVEFPWQFGTLVDDLNRALVDAGVADGRLGICEMDMPSLYARALGAADAHVETVDATGVLNKLIEAKSEYDQEMVRRSASIGDATMWEAMRTCGEGVAEYEVGIAAERVAAARGAEQGSGTTTRTHIYVASSSELISNVRPFRYTGRRLERGDMFFIDLSVCYRGYYTDFCRTIVIGEPSAEQRGIYDTVRACHQYMLDTLKPGMSGAEIFDLSMIPVTERTPEHADKVNFVWAGHGTGLIISEPPFFTPGEERRIQANTFINIEPGLFVPGVGNSSIEDMLFVSDDGVRLVTECPRDLHVAS
jgi:Xaa-Pro aminopeptidase